MAQLDWTRIAATALCITGVGGFALYLHAYEPTPLSERELAAIRTRSLANCGVGLADVYPHDALCPVYDRIALKTSACDGNCEAFEFLLHADGGAELTVVQPAAEQGYYTAVVGKERFRILANLLASLRLREQGGYAPPPPGGAEAAVSAGCGGETTLTASFGANPEDLPSLAQCFRALKARADWSLR